MVDDLWRWEARPLARAIRAREIRPREAVQSVLDRLSAVDPRLHAIAHAADDALAAAEAAEQAVVAGDELNSLHGVPITVKDLLATAGIRTSRGMTGLRDAVPTSDAPAVSFVRRAGAIVIAKTTTCELGFKATTESPLVEATANPWNVGLTAGGSSGGAGAALASGIAPLAVATDGGGSIRIPGSFNGVTGLKPTSGLVPTYPPSKLGPLGHTGPMARSVADVSLLLDAMTGARTTSDVAPLTESIRLSDLHIAYAPTVNDLPVATEVRGVVEAAVKSLQSHGAAIDLLDLQCSGFEEVWEVLYAAGVLADFRSLPPEVTAQSSDSLKDFIERAERLGPDAAPDAEGKRVTLVGDLQRRIDRFDIIATPTTPIPAFELGIEQPTYEGTSYGATEWWRLTQIWNLTGSPAITVPVGFTRTGLPVGCQLVGRPRRDRTLLKVAAVLEAALDLDRAPIEPRRPNGVGDS